MAKAPVPGQVKMRLVPALGAVGSAVFQARLIAHAVNTACEAEIGPVTLWASPDESHPAFQDAIARQSISLARQPEGDLGVRMLAAISANFPALVIGTDCPALTADHLRLAAATLHAGVDAVVLPAEDGGYVLIGMRRPQPALFADMPWGSDNVMLETRRRLVNLGLSWREPVRLWDVDRPEDLPRLREAGFDALLPRRPA